MHLTFNIFLEATGCVYDLNHKLRLLSLYLTIETSEVPNMMVRLILLNYIKVKFVCITEMSTVVIMFREFFTFIC